MKNNQKEAFYEEISKALWGYLSDKFTISLSELSVDMVNSVLKGKNISEEVLNHLTEVLNNCEFARFAPADSSNGMKDIYNQAIEIISKIESGLK